MKLIELSGKYGSIIGNYAMVDDENYEYLNQWKWYVSISNNGKKYVGRTENKKVVRMHRILLEIINSEIHADHIDGNGLNNQKSNLRKASSSQNMANRKKYKGISKYKGVTKRYRKTKNKIYTYWLAQCYKESVRYEKHCKTEIEAALWYNEKAKELHGEYALLNIIEQ